MRGFSASVSVEFHAVRDALHYALRARDLNESK